MNSEHCALFPVESGIPVIALGILLVALPIVTYLVGSYEPLPLPVTVVLLASGFFMIWLGIRR